MTLTINERSKEGLTFLNSLNFMTANDNEDAVLSGKQAALECNAVPLETFISELHRRVDDHFAAVK